MGWRPAAGWFLVFSFLALTAGLARGSARSSEEPQGQSRDAIAAKIEKYLKLARTGRAAVRPQAARRLSQLGAPAAARIASLAGAQGQGLVDLGPHVVEIVADFGEAELRGVLWRVLLDLDFPWRGPAARSLARTAEEGEVQRFAACLGDHIWQVRHAALDGLQLLDARDLQDEVRALLRDCDGSVRRAAAALLDAWGDGAALRFLVEDLKREDRYFRLPLGAQARFDAARILKQRLGDDFGFDPGLAPGEAANREALQAIEVAARKRAQGRWPALPAIARAATNRIGNTIGLELRSCRRGEFYLRWNEAQDLLIVGTGNAALVPLESGLVARLKAACEEHLAALGETRFWGASGCDLEQFRFVDSAGELRAYLLTKGQKSVGDLRPLALDRLARLLLESLPDAPSADPRLDRLKSRARAALEAVGGDL